MDDILPTDFDLIVIGTGILDLYFIFNLMLEKKVY